MSIRDYNIRQVSTGLVILAVLAVIATWLCFVVYQMVGYTVTTWGVLGCTLFFLAQTINFKRKPELYRAHLVRLNRSFWALPKAGSFFMALRLFNYAAILSLALHMWWVATVGAIIMSVIYTVQYKAAEHIDKA